MHSGHDSTQLCWGILSESMEAIICFTSAIEPARVLQWWTALSSAWNRLLPMPGAGRVVLKTLNFLITCIFVPFFFFSVSCSGFCEANQNLNSAWLNPLQLGRGSWNGLRGKMLGSTTEGGCSTATKACWSHWPGQRVDSRVSRWQNFKAQ